MQSDGSLADDDFLAAYSRAGRLVGAITVGQSEEREEEVMAGGRGSKRPSRALDGVL